MTDAPDSGTSTPPNPTGHDVAEPATRFFDWIRSTGIIRGDDRWLAGVCGGIARRAGLNPLVVRVIAIVLAVLGGPVLFAYTVGWALLPDAQGRIHAEQAFRGIFEPVMVAIIALLMLSFGSYTRGLWWQPPAALGMPDWLTTTLAVGWSIAVSIGIIWLVVFLVRRMSAPPGAYQNQKAGVNAAAGSASRRPEYGSWGRDRHPGAGFSAIVLGLALAAGAAAAGVYSAGVWSNEALLIGLAVALSLLALGIIVSGIRGRDSGAIGGFAFLAAAALVVVGVFPNGTQFFPFGAPVWAVSSADDDAVPGYAVAGGHMTIDLTGLDEARGADGRTIDVWMGFGVTELILPDRAIRVEANTLIGGIDYAGDRATQERGGVFFRDSRTFNGGDTRAIPQIRVWTLIGEVTIAGTNR